MNGLERYVKDQFDKGRARFLPLGMFCAKQREAMRNLDNKDVWKESVSTFITEVGTSGLERVLYSLERCALVRSCVLRGI
jgi:hypothetical protein